MENASQALFMAAGVLIAVMIISIGVYLFSSASTISENYDATMSVNEIQKFNNQFIKYEKMPKYIHNTNETIISYGNLNAGEKDNYKFFDYNNISEVITAINLAYNINSKNNYDIQSGVQITIELSSTEKYGITPSVQNLYNNKKIEHKKKNEKIPTTEEDNNFIYKIDDINNKKILTSIPSVNNTKLKNDLLKEYSNSKLIDGERIYEYGFSGKMKYNNETGLIDIVNFKLYKNETY